MDSVIDKFTTLLLASLWWKKLMNKTWLQALMAPQASVIPFTFYMPASCHEGPIYQPKSAYTGAPS